MSEVGWLMAAAGDVPAGDAWLSPAEIAVQAGLAFAKRRDDWRLGRWAAKRAVAARLRRPLAAPADGAAVSILASDDGAPEAYLDSGRTALSLSFSHRSGRAAVALADAGTRVGCDLELIEERSAAFVEDWLSDTERSLVRAHVLPALAANLLWSVKEAVAKCRREGLRLDVRRVEARPTFGEHADRWQPAGATIEGEAVSGWWRCVDDFVVVVVGEPACGVPVLLPTVTAAP